MNAERKIEWLNGRDPLHEWKLDEDVFCLHCDGVFKAQDVAVDDRGDPNCPVCMSSNLLDFHDIPWWREDLIAEVEVEDDIDRQWIGKAVEAVAGKPGKLPPRAGAPA